MPNSTIEGLASDSEMKHSVVASPFAWILLLVVVLCITVAIFVWMGGLRLVRRWIGSGNRKKNRKPNSRRDGYMRVDLEK